MEGSLPPIWKRYQQYLEQECLKTVSKASLSNDLVADESAPMGSVGIVGGGMAGLYSALLLQKYIPGVKVKIFEAGDRVGGRVYTHKFSSEPYQYFDTGAMRLPDTESHRPVFTLIDYLNQALPDEDPIVLEEFVNSCPEGNRVFLNNTKQKDGRIMSAKYASEHGSELGFLTEAEIEYGINAHKVLYDALTPVVEALEADFDAALKKYCSVSLFDYLSKDLGWSRQKIQYVEVIAGSTSHDFRSELIFVLMLMRSGVDTATWKAIEGGMSKLPEYCASVLARSGEVSILLNSKVEAIKQRKDGSTQVGYQGTGGSLVYESFGAVILAIPSPHIRMILERPSWGHDLEYALRMATFGHASKMLLRFKSRFWERSNLQLPPSLGGRSVTDLPIREVLYPSHGIGNSGKGILCVYQKDHDYERFTFVSKWERVKLALHNLQQLYPDVNIADEFSGGMNCEISEDAVFFQDWYFAASHYFPGDFLSIYPTLVTPRSNIYFTGGHLSPNTIWIVGAIESAKRTVQQFMFKQYGVENVMYI